MNYYAAASDKIATHPIDGGIEITAEQYNDALAMLINPTDKRVISIEGDAFALVDPSPEPEPEPTPPTTDEIIASFQAAIQTHIDEMAQQRRYEGGTSLAGYVASTNPAWVAEAQAFIAWRDAVWLHAYAELDKVTSGQRAVPTVDGFIAELPEMAWPP